MEGLESRNMVSDTLLSVVSGAGVVPALLATDADRTDDRRSEESDWLTLSDIDVPNPAAQAQDGRASLVGVTSPDRGSVVPLHLRTPDLGNTNVDAATQYNSGAMFGAASSSSGGDDHIIAVDPSEPKYPKEPSLEDVVDDRYFIDFIRSQLAQNEAYENEQGGYVYYNEATDQIWVVEVPMRESVEGGNARRDPPPTRPGFEVISGWHTHPISLEPLGHDRFAGPSNQDYDKVENTGQPELVIEPAEDKQNGKYTYILQPGDDGIDDPRVPFPNRDQYFDDSGGSGGS